jgi:hypothetical protein
MGEQLKGYGYIIPVDDSGIRAKGLWAEFEGRLYPAERRNRDFDLSWFGDDPPGEGWQRRQPSSDPAGKPHKYVKEVSAKDVTRYVSLRVRATWEGRVFLVMGFDAEGYVFLESEVLPEVALALVAGEHSWQLIDRNYVWGRVPVSELTDVVETVRELPLPRV